ncbi:hypothetical protein AAG906_021083 [Vitis piasezkii]
MGNSGGGGSKDGVEDKFILANSVGVCDFGGNGICCINGKAFLHPWTSFTSISILQWLQGNGYSLSFSFVSPKDLKPFSRSERIFSKRSILIIPLQHILVVLADPEMVTNEMSVAAQVSGHKNSLKLLGLLTYLHTAFPRPIIHRDIYPGNFYLDQDLCAKLSDFTLCMALPEGKTQVQSLRISGTVGYLAPEVLRLCVYSEKSDVFGFGLLLFDLLTGKDYRELVVSKGSMDDLKEDYLMDCIQSYIRNHGINGIVDPTILAEGRSPHHHQFQAVFRLILKCRRMNAEERPIMLDVAKQLRRIQRYCNSSKSSSFTNLYHDLLNWGSAHHNIYSRASS